jgi:rare lipoprotein A
MKIGTIIKALLLCYCLALLSTAYADGPPLIDRDVNNIVDAVPEPLPYNDFANQPVYQVNGQTYKLIPSTHGYSTTGIASWYGQQFAERMTASGEPYDMFAMTAASKVLPIPTFVTVTNLENGRSITVKVNDRGPFHDGRIMDLSYAAAKRLGMLQKGTAHVRITALDTPYNAALKAYYLQVATFRNLENATHLAQTLKTILVAPVAVKPTTTPYNTFYRVRIGPFVNIAEAQSLYTQLHQAGVNPGVLIAG